MIKPRTMLATLTFSYFSKIITHLPSSLFKPWKFMAMKVCILDTGYNSFLFSSFQVVPSEKRSSLICNRFTYNISSSFVNNVGSSVQRLQRFSIFLLCLRFIWQVFSVNHRNRWTYFFLSLSFFLFFFLFVLNSKNSPERSTEVTGQWNNLSTIRVKLPVDSLLRERNWHWTILCSFEFMYLRHHVNDKRCVYAFISVFVSVWTCDQDTFSLFLSRSSFSFATMTNASFDIDVRDRKPVWIVGSLFCFSRYTPEECTLYSAVI